MMVVGDATMWRQATFILSIYPTKRSLNFQHDCCKDHVAYTCQSEKKGFRSPEGKTGVNK